MPTRTTPRRNTPSRNPAVVKQLAAVDEILAQLRPAHEVGCPILYDHDHAPMIVTCFCGARPNREDVIAFVDYCHRALESVPAVVQPLLACEWSFRTGQLQLADGKIFVKTRHWTDEEFEMYHARDEEPIWISHKYILGLNGPSNAKGRRGGAVWKDIVKYAKRADKPVDGYSSYFEERWVVKHASPGLGFAVADDIISTNMWTYPRNNDGALAKHVGARDGVWRFVGMLHPGTVPGREGWWLTDSWAKELGFVTRSKLLGTKRAPRGPRRRFRVGDHVRYSSMDDPDAVPYAWRGIVTSYEPEVEPQHHFNVQWTRPDGVQHEGLYHQDDLIPESEAEAP